MIFQSSQARLCDLIVSSLGNLIKQDVSSDWLMGSSSANKFTLTFSPDAGFPEINLEVSKEEIESGRVGTGGHTQALNGKKFRITVEEVKEQ